ncbi:lantibiotic dehydratase [Pedobacter sp. N36a]|uniref:lantibiotic dehydratase n=1 Tax=Pedobacter sp. N36a TaxID=2767996 RepID=UPI001656FD90|nr:lantibiotic dehydratase [Pedobacter sp. N36a]MBC8986683.1 lantibiotic dehydratase [Pedobacter sp. N36a]
MKLTIHNQGLFRTPKFSLEAELADHWAPLKAAIQHASPSFYQQIKDLQAIDLDQIPFNLYCSIWKYFNRSKYRGTPYGSFAGVGTFNFQQNQNGPIILAPQQKLHEFTDWAYSVQVSIPINDTGWDQLLFVSNSSTYAIGSEIRYLCFNDGIYSLKEVKRNSTLMVLLRACKQPIKLPALIYKLKSQGYKPNHLKENLLELISLGLLFTSNHSNIIGQDYFKRIQSHPEKSTKKYILAGRKIRQGGPDIQLFKELPKAIHYLRHLVNNPKNPALAAFINKFYHKFEYTEIPIMEALDPEIGIGYHNLEQTLEETDSSLLSVLKDKNISSEESLKKTLWQYANSNTNKPTIIQLEQFKLPESKDLLSIPNSLSAIMTVSEDLLHVESIGGCTANALLGRFTLLDKQIKKTCKSIAKIEGQANPNVLFFDVAYTAEKHIDNINRRKRIYHHQLSILNYDTSQCPLELSDLYLSVHQDELILRSKKLNRRLIPRISSAYNYNRSDLPVFRLLCDLQHQGVQSDLNLDLQGIIPDCSSYPRVQYRNIVLSPAKWKIELDKIGDPMLPIDILLIHFKERSVPRYFRYAQADQTLFFDLQQQNDLRIFQQLLKKHKTLYIEEAFAPKKNYIQDSLQKNFQGQIQLSLTHPQELYPNLKPHYNFHSKKTALISPGGKWIYFEIYCHPQRSDILLQYLIPTFLKKHYRKIKKWFFIRYTENGHHLRLRLHLKNKKHAYDLISALSLALKEDLKTRTVSDIRLRIYKKETNRYGEKHIRNVEEHFFKDSQFALYILKLNLAAFEKYRLCSAFIYTIKESNLINEQDLKMLILSNSNSLAAEHHLSGKEFGALNKNYKTYFSVDIPELTGLQLNEFNILKGSFISILTLYKAIDRPQLLTDLIHMQLNRLFSTNQRMKEMVFYYYLSKDLQRNSYKATQNDY